MIRSILLYVAITGIYTLLQLDSMKRAHIYIYRRVPNSFYDHSSFAAKLRQASCHHVRICPPITKGFVLLLLLCIVGWRHFRWSINQLWPGHPLVPRGPKPTAWCLRHIGIYFEAYDPEASFVSHLPVTKSLTNTAILLFLHNVLAWSLFLLLCLITIHVFVGSVSLSITRLVIATAIQVLRVSLF